MEYISGEFGRQMSRWRNLSSVGLLSHPNLTAFDFHVEAIYALPITLERLS